MQCLSLRTAINVGRKDCYTYIVKLIEKGKERTFTRARVFGVGRRLQVGLCARDKVGEQITVILSKRVFLSSIVQAYIVN